MPVSVTVCGEPVASSLTDRFADKVPAADGSNATETTQESPVARLAPQVFGAITNDEALVPAMVSDVRVTVPVPVFFTVTL